MKKQTWQAGDLFTIELEDGSFALGLVLLSDLNTFDGPLCVFSSSKYEHPNKNPEITLKDAVSIVFTSSDQLDKAAWKVVGRQNIDLYKQYFCKYLKEDFSMIGIEIIGSGIIRRFMDACFGLYPWDGFFNPAFLDDLLLPGINRPDLIILK